MYERALKTTTISGKTQTNELHYLSQLEQKKLRTKYEYTKHRWKRSISTGTSSTTCHLLVTTTLEQKKQIKVAKLQRTATMKAITLSVNQLVTVTTRTKEIKKKAQ